MYIARKLESKLQRYLNSPEIIAIVGPRQSGKTTMVRHLINKLPNAVSISFDDQAALNLFEQSPNDFITAYVKGNRFLFIDEFQYAKSGGKILKYIFDTQKIKLIISGSSAIDLTIQAMKYLVGRIIVLDLFPLDFEELLSAKDPAAFKMYRFYKEKMNFFPLTPIRIPQPVHQKLLRWFEEYLIFGGFPRIVLEENAQTKQELLRNIYNTYFLREVRDILGLIDDYKLGNLIKAMALQVGQLISYQELSQLSGFSYPSLKKYLNFLEKTYVGRLVRPFFKNPRLEIVKNPKVYFFDTGLRNSVIQDFRRLGDRPDSGTLLENGFVMELIKQGMNFYFWRDKKQHEVDFVIPRTTTDTVAIELKRYARVTDLASLEPFKKAYPNLPAWLGFLSAEESIVQNGRGFPVYLF